LSNKKDLEKSIEKRKLKRSDQRILLQMIKQNISIKELENAVTSDDVLGKEVIDSKGEFLGVVESLFIDPETVEVAGIAIDKGLLKKGLIIGKSYIKNIAPHAIFLNIQPAYNLKGMIVFDREGKKMGAIREVQIHGTKNEIENIVIKSSIGELTIPSEYVKHIGDNVFLNETKENLLKLNQAS